jgi:hypothetical protein
MTATLALRMSRAPHCTPALAPYDQFSLIHTMHYEAPLALAQLLIGAIGDQHV